MAWYGVDVTGKVRRPGRETFADFAGLSPVGNDAVDASNKKGSQ